MFAPMDKKKVGAWGLAPRKIFSRKHPLERRKVPFIECRGSLSPIFLIKWRNWFLYAASLKLENSKGKAYTDFLSLRLYTLMVEAKQSPTSTSKKRHFLLQISSMGYKEYTQEEQCKKYTQEEQCPIPQKGLPSTQHK